MAWVFDWHGQDSRATGPLDVGCTVTQTYGAGGGNAPLVVDVLCRASTQGGAESQMNTATTLTTDHDRTIIAHKNEAVALQGNIFDYSEIQDNQTLSIAGKRAGLDGNRSGLFREAIRIILEMLKATGWEYPRFVIWENVPGALSSNGGKDFETVLNELLRLTGTDQFVRQRGKWGGYEGYGAVAYRLVNAQYWGVPQRRRRVYACCDTGGRSADKILFERKGDGWNFEPCIPAGQTVAGIAGDGYRWHERMVEAKPAGGGV